jgi:hypothetical protein
MVDAREIQPEELTPLSTGAWILGAGGGGSPYYSYLNVREQYKTGKRINLIDPKTLGDNDLVAVVSSMGAPLVGQERLRDHDFAAKPVRMMEEYLGRKFDAVMALEIGGGNALQPLMVATVTGYGPGVSRGADDQLRHWRPADVPAVPGRYSRQRDDHRPRRKLEVDGAHQSQGMHGGRIYRRHL